MLKPIASLSFVIPCYRSAKTIERVVQEIQDTMRGHVPYDVILVNDSSPDNTLEVLRSLSQRYKNIKVIDLSRNFGQHGAWMAGFHFATGDAVVISDDDGQVPISELPRLLEKLESGFDVVFSKYIQKAHSHFRNFGTWLSYLMTEQMIGKPKDLSITSFCVMRRFVIEEIIRYQNPYPYLAGLILKSTSKICNVEVEHRARLEGSSGYNWKKLFSLWINGFTAFSVKPLRIATLAGFISSLAGFLYGLVIIYNKWAYPGVPLGYSSLMAVLLYVSGMMMIFLGLIGEYVGRIYLSINRIPQFVVRETLNVSPIDQPSTAKPKPDLP